jgi:predicted  nucleic acid-binding Zn-ribbon protein
MRAREATARAKASAAAEVMHETQIEMGGMQLEVERLKHALQTERARSAHLEAELNAATACALHAAPAARGGGALNVTPEPPGS